MKLRAALRWHSTPDYTLIPVGTKLNKEEKRKFNSLFMAAEQTIKDETCASCGTVFWHGHSSNNNIQFELEEDTCFGCQAKDEMDKQRKNGQGKNHNDAGETTYITATTAIEGTKLPDREAWLKEQMVEYERKMVKRAAERRKVSGDGS